MPKAHTEKDTGDMPYLLRNRLLLGHLLRNEAFWFEEKTGVRDSFTKMLAYFGTPISQEKTGGAYTGDDDLQKRLAKLQGMRTSPKCTTVLQSVLFLSGHDYFVPGSPTEAAKIALAASILPNSLAQIKSVNLNPGRSPFAVFRRLGAEVDITSKRERFGDLYGNLTVKTAKKLAGRRIGPDLLAGCAEELPFFACLAACIPGEETVLHLSARDAERLRPQMLLLAQNLKKTGVKVGVFEGGMVLTGTGIARAAEFECGGDGVVRSALEVYARRFAR
jgi:hypothetical protein